LRWGRSLSRAGSVLNLTTILVSVSPMPDEKLLRISLLGDDLLRVLLELDAFRVCPPLETDSFLTLCNNSGLDVTAELLEQFEKKALFYPLLRVQLPIHRAKQRLRADGAVELCGTLGEHEAWEGPIHETYVWPSFFRHDLRQWMDEGLLYSPENRVFQAWDDFRDRKRRTAIASYYSPFQLFTLEFQLKSTSFLHNSAWIGDYSDEDFNEFFANLKEWAAQRNEPESRLDNPRFDAVALAQAIASRYSPQARGDLRTITTPADWDWHAYAGEWRADDVVARFGISQAEVKRYYEMLDAELSFTDPLEDWDDLLRFVHLSERKRLKGDAQYGQTIRAMRDMFGLLFKDLSGQPLRPGKGSLAERYALHEGSQLARSPQDRRARASGEVELLEFVANRYGLNPRPALVMFVEGDGEAAAIPRLVDRLFNVSLPVLGVEIRNLHGVAGFTGSKKERYGALEKVIEELHLSQTVVFVVLDNEGHGGHEIRQRLANRPSTYFPKRTVIRREFIHIWERSIELDNFLPEEIAAALTLAADERHRFTAQEVADASAAFGQRGDPISSLFNDRTQYALPKCAFLCHLVDQLQPGDARTRPLVVLIDEILDIAALNHKPTFVDTWFENQESGYLGHPIGGDERMPGRFHRLHGIQSHLD
jgi:hypothetical protein